ncbi:hypothetical protein GOE08_06760 [Sinorhizobium medicae]|nr:hypothetical protein [Sinorhizobium medicae]MDX1006587.1 hypothetical protein [Sinorhizobium medicae]
MAGSRRRQRLDDPAVSQPGLKAIFLVTTLTGTTTLWMAILADTGATVLVTANALRLLTCRSKK